MYGIDKSNFKDNLLKIDADSFTKSPSESIDRAVMEKTTDAVVIPMEINWNDAVHGKLCLKLKTKTLMAIH